MIQPRMPEVDVYPPDKMTQIFENARSMCSVKGGFLGLGKDRQVTLITPGRNIIQIPCPAPGSMPKDVVKETEQILPRKPPKHVVSIAFTELEHLMGADGSLDPQTIFNTIPFLGFLLGFSYIGHSVVIFEGHPTALKIGLKGADLVLVDERMAPHLHKKFVEVAYQVMRTPVINIYRMDGRVQRITKQ